MDRKGGNVVRGLSRFLLIAVCASLAAVSPPRATELATQLADGIWRVQGRAIPGNRRCGDWLVRLTNAQGQLAGVVSLARSSVPIQNLALLPDGSFSGTTPGGLGRIKTRALLQSHREVFGGYSQPYPRR